ncbi:MAG: TolC family protein, partial [Kofleriaceae bacterium]
MRATHPGRRLSAGLLAAALVAGCRLHHVQHDPAPPVAVADRWAAATPGAAALPDRWWQAFADPGLDRLVEDVLAGNLQLRAAWARVRQARSLVAQADAARLPQLELTAGAQRSRQRFEIVEGMVLTPTTNAFQVSLGAAYEVDLWRRVGSTRAAAALDALAVRDDAEALAMTLTAELAEAWFDVVATRAQAEVLAEQQRIGDTYLELMRLRFTQGSASALEIYQQEQQVLTTRAQREQADGALRTAGARVAVLRGRDP